ncbi:FAD-dependent oxidoreductase [Glaciibacter flavus]|uniref:FAD-dependent oxidoreductase n=1 Tax=Orlajensenia flava TaxID=2565934 RepID=A0A4S4FWS7_9MICO|nr:FAD-dependent monooxygenase [Glaciibacter flavus]THG35253.1 FAD-dependent oxidoreductase [Glaciibacter flavus]
MDADVIISGAGPNGLLLACELALGGARALVVERLDGRTTAQRANGLVGQVLQCLDQRGLYEPLAGSAGPAPSAPFFQFGGIPLDLRDVDVPLTLMMVPQTRIEEVLEARARELGVEIRRGVEVLGFRQTSSPQSSDGSIDVEVSGPAGTTTLTGAYVVGADGGRSFVRKHAGIDFDGVTSDEFVSRSAHVGISDDARDSATGGIRLGKSTVAPFRHNRFPTGVVAIMPLGAPGRMLVSVMEWNGASVTENDSAEPVEEELEAAFERVTGHPLPVAADAIGRNENMRRVIGVNSRQASRYRDGRVLLLGDAAHVHSAVGGPGLNLGLQDALNLGWKLAAVVSGAAPVDLLDSYESERMPASARVLMHTRAQMALMAPGPGVDAQRELLAELLGDVAARARLAGMLSGADVRYEMGGADPSNSYVGHLAPELTVSGDGAHTRLVEVLRRAKPVLVSGPGVDDGITGLDVPDTIIRVDAPELGDTALFIRPDGYVAWALDGVADAQAVDGLRSAIERWSPAPAFSSSAR